MENQFEIDCFDCMAKTCVEILDEGDCDNTDPSFCPICACSNVTSTELVD